jgi:hypothetical protein
MQCPECGTNMYKSIGGLDICPGCGFGSASVAEGVAQRQRQIDDYNKQMEAEAAHRSIVSGDWVLNIYYRFRGSKSEGQHGRLFHNGELIEPQQVGEIIDTDLGQMKYYCRLEDMELPWEPTGWNFADRKKILLSWVDVSSKDTSK